jgi:hypothetical protein
MLAGVLQEPTGLAASRLPANCRADCAVKALLNTGKLTQALTRDYVELSQEIEQRRKHRYD